MSGKSVFDLNENIAGALCYVLGFISGIFFLVMERENKFVRFHALQSTVLFLVLTAASWLAGILPIIRIFLPGIIQLATFAALIFLAYMAYKGRTFKVPVLGNAVWDKIYG